MYGKRADVSLEGNRVIGKVKWFNKLEGYGFIGQTDGPDVFVHYSAIQDIGYRSLSEGDSVEFQTVKSPEGPQAAKVRKREPKPVFPVKAAAAANVPLR